VAKKKEATMSSKKKKTITRRQFISDTSVAAIGSTLFLGAPASLFSSPGKDKTSTVVLIRDKNVLDENGTPRSEVVLEMLDTAVKTLTGKKDPFEGWKTFIKPGDIVGIKTNVWTPIGTTRQVEQSLKKRVMDVGVKESNIGILDRGVWRDKLFKKATALINARPMRTHHWSGVGSLIKNYIMFVPDPFNYHGDSCADLGKIWGYPLVKGKTRLNVLVMFTPQFHNVGPHGFSPRHVWKYYGMLVGFDPVAIDSIGVQIIQAQRTNYFGEDRPLNPPAKHILLADTRYHLGTADPKKIDLVKIGYDKDILV
jgi:hypothetical protein